MMEAGVSNGTAKVCTNRCEIVVSNQTAGTQVEIAAPSQDGVTVLVNGVEWGPVAKREMVDPQDNRDVTWEIRHGC